MSFWPTDIFAANNQSPREIMESAGAELSSGTQILTVSIRETTLTDRVVLAFIVQNETHSLEFNVFEASHQLDRTYPVVIDRPTDNIPEFLKRERKIRGSPGIKALGGISLSVFGETPDSIIKNEWISATPQEFREKLKKVFSLDFVKSNIVSLLAPPAVAVTSVDEAETQDVGNLEEEQKEVDEAEGMNPDPT